MTAGACGQELCRNWTGDGFVCACLLFELEPDLAEEEYWDG